MAISVNQELAGLDGGVPDFSTRLFVGAGVLPEPVFSAIAADIERFSTSERSYLPAHKKGGAIAYETLRAEIPRITELYQSSAMRDLISRITGVTVMPTPLSDKSSCSLLVYEEPGDHIGWHYDHNFYKGRHFTILIPIVNRGRGADGFSAARLMVRMAGGDRSIATPPNAIVVFEGARVRHKVTPIDAGERRIVLSMTYCTDPRNSALQEGLRRIKDTAFFGLRALWARA